MLVEGSEEREELVDDILDVSEETQLTGALGVLDEEKKGATTELINGC